jgi:hypothetical protein
MEIYLYLPICLRVVHQASFILHGSVICVCVGTCACLYRVGVAMIPQTCLPEVLCANHGCVRVSVTGSS